MTNPAAAAHISRTRRALRLLVFVALLVSPVWAAATLAQSGRRKTDLSRQSPAPTPTPEASPRGESESQPSRGAAPKNTNIVATFVVVEDDSLSVDFSLNGTQRDIVSRSFHERLRRSQSVEVVAGSKGTRGTARQRAKQQNTAYVVHLQLEEDVLASRDASRGSRDTLGRRDASVYALRLAVYAPGSGDLKFEDLFHQRNYRPTARVGGVPVPVPVGPERVPGEYQLAQLARDAADRLLARFDIARPPDN